ncbi:hypothetical protein HK101_009695 [Irineochytrium annulatum]|nr:hypothetical protein HK101_009695 [Irineochytrium annulatum]
MPNKCTVGLEVAESVRDHGTGIDVATSRSERVIDAGAMVRRGWTDGSRGDGRFVGEDGLPSGIENDTPPKRSGVANSGIGEISRARKGDAIEDGRPSAMARHTLAASVKRMMLASGYSVYFQANLEPNVPHSWQATKMISNVRTRSVALHDEDDSEPDPAALKALCEAANRAEKLMTAAYPGAGVGPSINHPPAGAPFKSPAPRAISRNVSMLASSPLSPIKFRSPKKMAPPPAAADVGKGRTVAAVPEHEEILDEFSDDGEALGCRTKRRREPGALEGLTSLVTTRKAAGIDGRNEREVQTSETTEGECKVGDGRDHATFSRPKRLRLHGAVILPPARVNFPIMKPPAPCFKTAAPVAVPGTSGRAPPARINSEPVFVRSAGEKGMWTTKYRPRIYDEIMGNRTQVEKLAKWLRAWQPSNTAPKQMPKDAPGAARAILISGAPGVGKTTAAHLVARLEGYDVVELNASDARSSKTVKAFVGGLTGCHTLTAFRNRSDAEGRKCAKRPAVLIMDEVDGMSPGDRGGIGELIRMIKGTKVPIICICNDRQSSKLRALAGFCFDLRFLRPQTHEIESKIKKICEREGLAIKPAVIDILLRSTQGDIRQILTMLEHYSLTGLQLGFEGSKELSKQSEKNLTANLWDLSGKLLGKETFRGMSFEDKLDIYYRDHSGTPLMIQENIIKMDPSMSGDVDVTSAIGAMRLLSAAADACRDGDLIDTSMRRNNDWSLMPVHGVMSTVKPSFFVHGAVQGSHASRSNHGLLDFPAWFAHNNAHSRFKRVLIDLAARIINVSRADTRSIREDYVPHLAERVTRPVVYSGEDVQGLIKGYGIDCELREGLIGLGVGRGAKENLLDGVEYKAKGPFFRRPVGPPQPRRKCLPRNTTASLKYARASTLDATPDFEDAVELEPELDEDDEGLELTKDSKDSEETVQKAKGSQNGGGRKTATKSTRGRGGKAVASLGRGAAKAGAGWKQKLERTEPAVPTKKATSKKGTGDAEPAVPKKKAVGRIARKRKTTEEPKVMEPVAPTAGDVIEAADVGTDGGGNKKKRIQLMKVPLAGEQNTF